MESFVDVKVGDEVNVWHDLWGSADGKVVAIKGTRFTVSTSRNKTLVFRMFDGQRIPLHKEDFSYTCCTHKRPWNKDAHNIYIETLKERIKEKFDKLKDDEVIRIAEVLMVQYPLVK